MKSKGFTLIELLGVILLIALIGTISAIVITDLMETSHEKSWDITKKNVEKAAKSYVLEKNVNIEMGESVKITMNQLYEAGYITIPIINPINDEVIEIDSIEFIAEVYMGDNGKLSSSYIE